MKEIFNNRPATNFVLEKSENCWLKEQNKVESQKIPQKENTENHLFYNTRFFLLENFKFLFGGMSPSFHMLVHM